MLALKFKLTESLSFSLTSVGLWKIGTLKRQVFIYQCSKPDETPISLLMHPHSCI